MWAVLLIVGLIIALLLLLVMQQNKKPKPVPTDLTNNGIPRGLMRANPTFDANHLVVGPLIPDNASVAERLVAGDLIRLGDPDIEFPVGTLLVNSAPEDVQVELLTSIPISPLQGIEVPESFDSREQWPGLISGPYHQGSCGSCWAFASAIAISDRMRIVEPTNEELTTRFMYRPFAPDVQYPVMNNLSPYELVSCDTCGKTFSSFPLATSYVSGPLNAALGAGECDMGCEGGYLQVVYNYIRNQGLTSLLASPTACDPTIQDCSCRRGDGARVYKPSRVYSLVSPTESKEIRRRKIMEDVYQRGPLSIGYAVYQSFYNYFSQNPTGVYSNMVQPHNDRLMGGHAVAIVGWGTDPQTGIFYWIMRNSWGLGWGDQGFFKIQYDFEGILDNVMAAEA